MKSHTNHLRLEYKKGTVSFERLLCFIFRGQIQFLALLIDCLALAARKLIAIFEAQLLPVYKPVNPIFIHAVPCSSSYFMYTSSFLILFDVYLYLCL